jgi:lysophospholipase L1-like esterase
MQVGDLMNGAVRAAGVPLLDGWAVFETELRSPNHAALFGTQDEHFSAHGRAVIADAVAAFLAKLHPWQK